MCNYRDGLVEYTEDDYGLYVLTHDMGDMHLERGIGDSDSEDEEYGQSVCPSVILCCCAIATGTKSPQDWFEFSSYWESRSYNIIFQF